MSHPEPRLLRGRVPAMAGSLVALLLVGITLAGCGTDDGEVTSTAGTAPADAGQPEDLEILDNAAEFADAEISCSTFGDEFGLAVDDGAATDDPAAKAEALSRIEAVVSTVRSELGQVSLSEGEEQILMEILASFDDLSTEIDLATGDADLTADFFNERPDGVAIAVENITARASELSLRGCEIQFVDSAG